MKKEWLTFVLIAVVVLLSLRIATGQTQNATELVLRLCHPELPVGYSLGLLNGQPRSTAIALADLGAPALPAIEKALRSLEERGRDSEFFINSGWLLLAYARIEGPSAYPRLRTLIEAPNLTFLLPSFDRAAALSFGITSYVSGYSQASVQQTAYWAYAEHLSGGPRERMELFTHAWEEERLGVHALGPNARTAVDTFLKGRNLLEWSSELWKGRSGVAASVGYQFKGGGTWAWPAETLKGESLNENFPRASESFQIDVAF